MAEQIFYWLFVLGCIFAFVFGYTIVEDLIRSWRRDRRPRSAGFSGGPAPGGNGHEWPLLQNMEG